MGEIGSELISSKSSIMPIENNEAEEKGDISAPHSV